MANAHQTQQSVAAQVRRAGAHCAVRLIVRVRGIPKYFLFTEQMAQLTHNAPYTLRPYI